MTVHYEVIKGAVGPPKRFELNWFVLKNRHLVQWKCVPLLVSYICDSFEAKSMSDRQESVAVSRPHVRCKVAGENIVGRQMAGQRFVTDTKMIRSSFLEIPRKKQRALRMEMK